MTEADVLPTHPWTLAAPLFSWNVASLPPKWEPNPGDHLAAFPHSLKRTGNFYMNWVLSWPPSFYYYHHNSGINIHGTSYGLGKHVSGWRGLKSWHKHLFTQVDPHILQQLVLFLLSKMVLKLMMENWNISDFHGLLKSCGVQTFVFLTFFPLSGNFNAPSIVPWGWILGKHFHIPLVNIIDTIEGLEPFILFK